MPPPPERAWYYGIDAEGHLWHEGAELDDPDLLKFFMERMQKLPDGRGYVLCQGEDCYLKAEDALYVVQDVKIAPQRIELVFSGGYEEKLDPTTLHVGEQNVLYCQIRGGEFEARFNRKSYLELARHVKFDGKTQSYYIPLGGKNYPIHGVSPGET